MILLKKDIDSDELKKIEEESQRQALAYITPIKEKLENAGYTVDYNCNSDSDCSGDVSKQGFEEDKNWNN